MAELADRAARVDDLFHHRLATIAARQLRAAGRPLPQPLLEEEHFAASSSLAAREVMNRVLEALDVPVLVIKGPEVACRYPDATMRPHHDLDLLVEDSAPAHRALIAAGGEEAWDRPSEHHELPVAFPDLPLLIELHHAPKGPPRSRMPGAAELFADAVPSIWEPRAMTPAPAQHAVLLAAHAWAERPLRRVTDLVDVDLLLAEGGREEASRVAARWGLTRVWNATLAAVDSVIGSGSVPWTVRTWARNLPAVRERSRAEELLERALAPFAGMPALPAAREGVTGLVHALHPRSGESLAERLRRGSYEHPALSSRGPSRARD